MLFHAATAITYGETWTNRPWRQTARNAGPSNALPRLRANAFAWNAGVPQCDVESLLRDGHEGRSS